MCNPKVEKWNKRIKGMVRGRDAGPSTALAGYAPMVRGSDSDSACCITIHATW